MSGRQPKRQPRSSANCSRVANTAFAHLDEAIDDYVECHRVRLRAEMGHYEEAATLREAITRAARAERPDGKRHDHQRRLPPATLREAERALLAIEPALAGALTFHELMRLVEDAFDPIRGAGELFVYDTALRIGAKLGLQPDSVYLHRGTRGGARRFHPAPRGTTLDLGAVPRPLRRRLSPSEIEDFLCIYKDRVRSWT